MSDCSVLTLSISVDGRMKISFFTEADFQFRLKCRGEVNCINLDRELVPEAEAGPPFYFY